MIIDGDIIPSKSKTGSLTINADVDVSIDNEDNSFVVSILVVIVCVILLIAGFFLVRICMTQRQRKVIIEEDENDGKVLAVTNKKGLDRQSSQPPMRDQFIPDQIDYLELTKKSKKKAKM